MQQILHQKLLQSCILYCKCQGRVFLFCLFYKYLTLYYTKPRGLERDVYPSVCTIYFIQCSAFSTAAAPYSAGRNAINVFLTSKEAEVKEPSTESCVFSQVCYTSQLLFLLHMAENSCTDHSSSNSITSLHSQYFQTVKSWRYPLCLLKCFLIPLIATVLTKPELLIAQYNQRTVCKAYI